QKGLTQEDLVERCNINVRTIQRIEAGEVSPRSYTLKLILEALGYDLNQMKQEFDWHEKNAIQPPKHFSKIMNLAFWIGIVFVIAISLNVFVEIMMELEPKLESKEGFGFQLSEDLYATLQFVCAICAFFFYFIYVRRKYQCQCFGSFFVSRIRFCWFVFRNYLNDFL